MPVRSLEALLSRFLTPLIRLAARLVKRESAWERVTMRVPASMFGPGSQRPFAEYFEGESCVRVGSIDDIVAWLQTCELCVVLGVRLKMRMRTACSILFGVVFVSALAPSPSGLQASGAVPFAGLSWRSIGPAMFAGRVADVAGVPGKPDILYVAAASSGLYKSVNGGTTFDPVFENGNTLSIGAIAVQPDNPDVVYVGTGEGAVRNSISFGDGVYRTIDGGKTWMHLGLEKSERFSRIVIHPTNRQIVLAAAMGKAFGPGGDRGIYRTTDGGASWTRTLAVNDTTGASDVAIDPGDPNTVYAGMYDYQRGPWFLRSGGPGSGLYRSSDGGVTWKKLTDPALKNGLPGAPMGRIGVSVSASDPRVVYALIESQEGVMWRSEDRGATWTIVSSDHRINNRPFYYTQVRVDPTDPSRVYTMSGSFNVSTDGGRTWGSPGGRMFGDHHALWIDPLDPKRLLCGTDGGFFISRDYGRNWDFVNNMPMAQAYHLGVDMAEPYHVMGGFQDHEIWRGPNEKWNQIGVREGDWVRLRYMADGMHAIADPRDPNIIYYNGHFGDITRLDMRNQEERYVQPYPPGPNGGGAIIDQYRFNWNSPVHMSPTNPDVVYYGGNVLFRTTDRGETWSVISPDLTTNDKTKQMSSGGPVSNDNTRAEFHCTIISIAESPRDRNVIWAGTDDGNLQVTRDGGRTWTNVARNIAGAPKFSWVSSIAASKTGAGTAYISIDQHRLDDFAPYVFVTTDYGQTWRRISQGLTGYVHVVKEDPKEPNLVYAGTELGFFASFDRAATWTDLRLGLPHLAVVDLVVHPRDNDLVIATHARGFYILDDITPLQHIAAAASAGGRTNGAPASPIFDRTRPMLFLPMAAVRYIPASDTSVLGNRVWVAPNQPYGAIINYYLPAAAPSGVDFTVIDRTGRTVSAFKGPSAEGVNRAVWTLAEQSSCGPASEAVGRGRGRGSVGGGTWIRAIPGEYTVRLTVSGTTLQQPVTVRLDPRVKATPEEMEIWHITAQKIEKTECTLARAGSELAQLERELAAIEQRTTNPPPAAALAAARRDLRPVVLALRGEPRDPEHVNLPARVNWLTIQVGNNSGRPTAAQMEWIGTFADQTSAAVSKLEEIKAIVRKF
jgi:photosystem II stability/assembly factor-like uncharacterized protein